jgi:ADP-ribosyl-[dinitrogen reductase] hydrolase
MSMLGACVGDAAGATLEFMSRTPTAAEVETALTFPGSARHRLAPGQITDDGELTLALWSALHASPPKLGPPIDKVLRAYVRWWRTEPHDVGFTCSNAFQLAQKLLGGQIANINEYLAKVQEQNGESQANGALMRATAIAHWAAGDKEMPASMAALAARVDARLSHPNSVCQDCNALYVYACVLLLRGMQPTEAFRLVGEYAMQTVADQTVLKWLFNDSQDIVALNCRENIGHVRWGFTLAFYFMQNPHIDFEEALRITLLKGGDTDTNAAIVGGLVGCYRDIPDRLKEPVMKSRPEGRPEWLWPWTYFM